MRIFKWFVLGVKSVSQSAQIAAARIHDPERQTMSTMSEKHSIQCCAFNNGALIPLIVAYLYLSYKP